MGLINDILDISKIESGELQLSNEAFELNNLLLEIRDSMRVSANAKGLALQVHELPADAPTVLVGDPVRIRQILSNLVENAIKFTPQGSVSLKTFVNCSDNRTAKLRFDVEDTGIGIPDDIQPLLFDRFKQAKKIPGTTGVGLGLAIVSELTRQMGGQVELHSVIGNGSCFRVDIELALGVEAELPPPTESSPAFKRLAGMTILVVDDSDTNLDVACQMLQYEGAKTYPVENGRDALTWLDNARTGVDAILMDIHMPIMDGIEAVRRIRTNPRFHEIPVIAMTAAAMKSDRDEALAAGMNDYLTKPFSATQLVEILHQHVSDYRVADVPSGERQALKEPDSWPALDGIDIEEVKLRLSGDWKAFLKHIERLLKDYKDLADILELTDSTLDIENVRARLHRLAGNAGMLGVNTVMESARSAEQLLKSTKLDEANRHLHKLADAIATLAAQITPLLHENKKTESSTLKDERTYAFISECDLRALEDNFRSQRFSALEEFKNLSPALRAQFPVEIVNVIEAALDNLDLTGAADAVAKLREHGGSDV